MTRCDSCAEPARFLDWNLECSECAKGSPLERAAIALFDVAMINLGWPSKQWDDPALDAIEGGRGNFRNRARTALTAAVDVTELAEHIGPDHARIVRDHLLGSQEP